MGRMIISHKILVIGDLHFKAGNAIQTGIFSEKIAEYITQCQKSRFTFAAIAVLGDILHRHDKIDIEPMTRAVEFLGLLRRISDSSTHLIITIGNHDLPNNNSFESTTHAFNAMKLWKNTTVSDKATEVEVRHGAKFLSVPYTYPGRFMEAVGKRNLKDYVAVFAHQEFRGAKRGEEESSRSTIGDVYPESEKAGVCISGHIHFYDETIKNVIYPGTPFTDSWVHDRDLDSRIHAPMLIDFTNESGSWKIAKKERLFDISGHVPKSVKMHYVSTQKIDFERIRALAQRPNVRRVRVFVDCDSTNDDVTSIVKGTAEMNGLKEIGVSFVPNIINENKVVTPSGIAITRDKRIPFKDRITSHPKYSELSENSIEILNSLI